MSTDIDIDFANREQVLKVLTHTPAMQLDNGVPRKHNTGVYFHNIPVNPFTGLATVDYKKAEELGWFKIDLLNVGIYSVFKNNEEIDQLLAREPVWELLEHDEVIQELFHISRHADIVKKHKPRSVEQLAMVLALIRPGKKHLIGKSWQEIEQEVWIKDDNAYSFKRSHSYGYALAIILQLNKMVYG